MVYLLNTNDTVGYAIWGMNSITGSFYISLLVVFILLVGVAFIFRMPLEIVLILLLPLGIGFTVASGNFMPVLVTLLIFAGVIVAKKFFFNN
jgi:hypothetical protein